jgi:hypothetical protein
MTNPSPDIDRLFTLLEGTWTGEGRGGFPTVRSFDHRDTLTFTQRGEKTLAYEQRAQKRYDGQTDWLVSHWESGFLRILENGALEMTSAQIGRNEVLVGSVTVLDPLIRIHFVSKSIMNDPRVVCSERFFELDGDILSYEMNMQTTKVDRLTPHLKITLRRVK